MRSVSINNLVAGADAGHAGHQRSHVGPRCGNGRNSAYAALRRRRICRGAARWPSSAVPERPSDLVGVATVRFIRTADAVVRLWLRRVGDAGAQPQAEDAPRRLQPSIFVPCCAPARRKRRSSPHSRSRLLSYGRLSAT